MVAKINSGKSIIGIINYNENKVKAGVAQCIHENLYGRDVDKLTFYQKVEGLTNYSERNRRAVSNAVHISLNFHPDEKLDNEKVKEIADAYMDKIGFGDQPYLVYRHNDAAHPHVHIVTTNIQHDGKRIVMYNIGRNQSEKARKEIEQQFKLITAAGREIGVNAKPSPSGSEGSRGTGLGNVQRAVYGKTETKQGISNAVTRALGYKFTSLAEFNAVLKQFNVVADRGKEGSRMFNQKGLIFFILDESGKKVGVPIKASSLYSKPTIKNLEARFTKNEALRSAHREHVRQCIDKVFADQPQMETRKFIRALNRERIFVLFRQNEQAVIYGITFVDNRNRVVFNGSDLGKMYSAKAITARLTDSPDGQYQQNAFGSDHTLSEGVIDELLMAKQYDSTYDPYFRRKRKKKLKRSQ